VTNPQPTYRSVGIFPFFIPYLSRKEIAIAKTTHPRYNIALPGRVAQLVRAHG
jgi:hypothetical protein